MTIDSVDYSVDLTWYNPTENTAGYALTSISGVRIYRNDEMIADLPETVPGAFAQYTDIPSLQDGYRYKVLAYTEEDGIYAFTFEQWIGPPAWAAPTGPDAYGYIAFESVDPEGPDFDWIEIDPTQGGSGTLLNFTLDDQTLHLDLPFSFKYYGLEYDEISVCENGWIAMGYTEDTDYSNTAIPNSDGPPAMLAPFWEDFSPQQSGSVSCYYDAVNHWYIIEYYRVRQYLPTTVFETFQAVLYDPAHHTTATGDGKILFQWLDITDPSQATFGIENQAEAVGIQLGLDGSYPASVIGIQDNYSVLFMPPEENFPVTASLVPTNPPVVIPAAGGSFDYTVLLTSIGQNPATFNVGIDVMMPNGSIYGPTINRTMTLDPGTFFLREMTQSVPGNAPAGEYTYRCTIGDYDLGIFWDQDQFTFTKEGVDIASGGDWECYESSENEDTPGISGIPSNPVLQSAYPNPFNPETTISFELGAASFVTLIVYDVTGREVARLTDGWHSAGVFEYTWNASEMASGVYFARFIAGDYRQTRKLLLVK